MSKYTVIYKADYKEMPYSLYCEPVPGVSLEEALKGWGIRECDVMFIFEGWPRRVSLLNWEEDIKECDTLPPF